MKSLTLIFYAAATFFLGVIALSSVPLAVASVLGSQPAQAIEDIVSVLTIALTLVFLGAIPFAGTRKGE